MTQRKARHESHVWREEAGSLEQTMVDCQQQVAQTLGERRLERIGLLMLPVEMARFFLQKAKASLCRPSGGRL